LLADAWAVQQAGAFPLCVATALTAQGGRRFSLNPVPVAVLSAQLGAARAAGAIGAVKLGMVASRAQLLAIVRALRGLGAPWVIDPVTRTSRGEVLSTLEPRDYRRLAQPTRWLTPNTSELQWLGVDPVALVAEGFGAVLVKGGARARDVLVRERTVRTFQAKSVRRDPVHHRGTGCRLASALAARLASGDGPEAAVLFARGIVLQFLSRPIMRTVSAG
jgi:hydroxymethylpyrimidine/phosphomethylpyrimidine kinase